MPSALVREVIYRASVLLQDIAPQFQRWSERELVSWLNDGQVAIAKYLPSSCARIDVVKLKPGTRQSIAHIVAADVKPGDGGAATDLYGNFLNDIVRNMGPDGLTPGRPVRVVSRDMMDGQFPDWHTAASKGRVESFMFDPRTPKYFYVYPGVPASGAAQWVELSFLADPVPVAVPAPAAPGSETYRADGPSTTPISIDDRFVDDLLNYVLARAYMKDSEFAANAQAATGYTNMFLTSINSQVQALTGNNPNLQTLPLAPTTPAAAR
jgi:hypothetical protein